MLNFTQQFFLRLIPCVTEIIFNGIEVEEILFTGAVFNITDQK